MTYIVLSLYLGIIIQIPHKAQGEKPGRAAERAARELEAKNKSYQLVSESDEEESLHIAPKKVCAL